MTLLLSLTDQFGREVTAGRAREILPRIQGEYERAYYAGIISERSARARHEARQFRRPVSKLTRSLWKPCAVYEQAEACRPPGNDDSLLRWNTCARTLMRNHDLRPQPQETLEPVLDD